MTGRRPTVALSVDDRTAWVTIDRPDALNAIDASVRSGLREAFTRVAEDDEILVAVLIGAGGRAFSAGADLKELASAGPPTGDGGTAAPRPGRLEGWDQVDACPKPVIAAIDGHCLAGGLELALYCDIRLATRQSSFGLPEPRRSLLAGPGLVHLSRMVPLGEALRIQLTGSPIGAERAHQIGLVQELTDDRDELVARAGALAAEIRQCAPLAVRHIKRIVKETRAMPVADAWAFAEPLYADLAASEDAAEGPRAFAEKRPPRWRGR